jgi:hypothetical protein
MLFVVGVVGVVVEEAVVVEVGDALRLLALEILGVLVREDPSEGELKPIG